MRDEDEGDQRPAVAHRIGESLDALSVDELGARIALLNAEIGRLEAARAAKAAALERAGSIFRL